MLRRGDERAVSAMVGAVLLLGILVTALAMYQVNVVPSDNYEVEVNHNERVQGDLQDLRNTIVSVPGGNSGGSTTVTLGTSYPERTFAVNPGRVSGSLESESIGTIRIENAEAPDGEEQLADIWSDGEYETYGLTYSPDYNEYRNAPETVYEHGSLFNHHPNDANIPLSDQILIDDDEITLVAMRGNLSTSGSGSTSVDARAFSTSSNTITLEKEDGDENINITLPTSSPSYWNETLSDVGEVNEDSIQEGDESISFELTGEEYSLRMAEVGIGDASRDDPVDRAEYIHVVDKQEPFATVEVRDKFNNPVSNVDITIEKDGNSEKTRSTGSNGQVRFDVEEVNSVTVGVSDNGDVDTRTFDVESTDTGPGNGGGGAYDVFWNLTEIEECDSDSCTFEADSSGDELEMVAETSPEVDGATVEYVVSDRSIAEFSPSEGKFENGRNETQLMTKDEGTVTAYVLSGGNSHQIDVHIETIVDDVDISDVQTSNQQNSVVSFTIENSGEEDIDLETIGISDTTVEDVDNLHMRDEVRVDGETVFDGRIDIGDDEDVSLDETTISEGDSVSVSLDRFRNGGHVDMSGETITILLNGNEFELEVPDDE